MAEKLSKEDKNLLKEDAERLEAEQEAFERRIEARELLKECEPVAWGMLDKAVRENTLSHACLFNGPKGSLKKDMAVLLAQTLLCGCQTGLIEEEHADEMQQRICRRTASDSYSGFIFLDGCRKQMIAKEEVDRIESRFSKTAAEGNGVRVYVIDHMENASAGAQNSLLKFLEEPADNVYAILTCDNPQGVLQTIRSRCVSVSFRPVSSSVFLKYAEKAGLDQEDAWLISSFSSDLGSLADAAVSASYQNAKKMLKQYLGLEGDRRLLLVDYDVKYRVRAGKTAEEAGVRSGDARDENMDVLIMFFSMLIQFARAVILCDDDGPAWYHNAVTAASLKNNRIAYADIMRIASEERDLVNRNNDLNLLFAQAMYRLEVLKK